MATVNKTAPSQEKKIMNTTAFDQIKNDPRSTIEKLSSFKREANYDGQLFGVLAVGEFVTVTTGSVSNDRIFTIKVNDHPSDYLSPLMLWGTHLVGYVYEQCTPWDCHGQDIDSPHIDTDGYIAEMNDTGATLYTVIEESETRRTLAQLIRFGGNIDIYDHDAFASWAGTVTNHDFRECIRWSPRQEIKEGFMQDACARIIVRDPRETEHGTRGGEYGKNWNQIRRVR